MMAGSTPPVSGIDVVEGCAVTGGGVYGMPTSGAVTPGIAVSVGLPVSGVGWSGVAPSGVCEVSGGDGAGGAMPVSGWVTPGVAVSSGWGVGGTGWGGVAGANPVRGGVTPW